MAKDSEIAKIFARNLRRYSERQDSIAAICAATKINRQQYNKYLSGKVLPGSLNLRRICEFLGIQEAVLFEDGNASSKPIHQDVGMGLCSRAGATGLLDTLSYKKENLEFLKVGLNEGYYYSYFSVPQHEGMLLRSLVWIYVKDQQMRFVRVTSARAQPDGKGKALIRIRQSGIMFSNGREIFMMGFNRYGAGQLALSVFPKPGSKSSNGFISGHTLTRDDDRILSLWSVLVPIDPQISVRASLKGVGIVEVNDPAIDNSIKIAFPDSAHRQTVYLR
jgi:transcriptional regulator with XRE-family HTH domain